MSPHGAGGRESGCGVSELCFGAPRPPRDTLHTTRRERIRSLRTPFRNPPAPARRTNPECGDPRAPLGVNGGNPQVFPGENPGTPHASSSTIPTPGRTALRLSPFALRPSPFARRPSPVALRPSPFALRPSPFARRASPFALRPSPFALRPSPVRPAAPPSRSLRSPRHSLVHPDDPVRPVGSSTAARFGGPADATNRVPRAITVFRPCAKHVRQTPPGTLRPWACDPGGAGRIPTHDKPHSRDAALHAQGSPSKSLLPMWQRRGRLRRQPPASGRSSRDR